MTKKNIKRWYLTRFGFDRTIYGVKKNTAIRKWLWMEELRREREGDIKMENDG
jgi:hypothetical protein